MRPTPTETPCPPVSSLRRLLQPNLPEEEAAPLREHIRTCHACREVWQTLQAETVVGHTPSPLQPVSDTNHGRSAPLASSAIVWSSEIGITGAGSQRQPVSNAGAVQETRMFSFLSPPQREGELGWLAHYRVTGVLGEGGMGFVFDAFDTSLNRRVALKVLKPELAANKSFRERFLHEARAAAALPDDYIFTVYQVGVEKDVPFLAMKFLYGESLEQRLQRDGRLPTLEILRIGREIALGLSAAHERGLIHRDIKPANLWLETPAPEHGDIQRTRLSFEHSYRVKILDFGLARPINDSRRLTATGLIVGTPQYLAPEQARGQPLDHRCDLFSLGIVLYRMATGLLPFDGADTLAQLTALAVEEPRPLEEAAPDVPKGLRQLIHQLLARDPAKRPQTARVVAEALRALEKSETPTSPVNVSPARQPGLQDLSAGKKGRWNRRHWLLAGGLLALMGILGGWSWWWRGSLIRSPSVVAEDAAAGPDQEPIKVGILFSMRGAMMSGGSPAHDAAQLAIDELNQQGGLLGRRIVAIHKDGLSDYRIFAEEAERLIAEDRVCVLFGSRASVNRKAVKEIVEKHDHLLFYPQQFEGLEDSPNIIYLGAVPNQQMFPAIDYMLDTLGKRKLFLVGSDYIFPRAANEVLRSYLKNKHPEAEILDERYVPYGDSEVREVIQAIREKKPDLILNTINGDTNISFFRELDRAGLRADKTTVLSFSLSENELPAIGVATGHYAAWSYFQSIDSSVNRTFVRRFQKQFGERRVVSDPMETVYFGIHLWARAVQAAGSVEPRAVRESIVKGGWIEAPEGHVLIDAATHYTWRAIRIGRVKPDGQFEIVFDSVGAIPPQPFPSTRSVAKWKQFLKELYTGWGNKWINEK